MVMMDVAADLTQLGTALQGDLVAWGGAILGVAVVASGFFYIMRLIR